MTQHPGQRLRFAAWAMFLVLFGLALGHGFAAGASNAAAVRSPSEQQVKAGVIANLPKYVQWPASAAGGDTPMVIVIVGDEQLAEEMRVLTGGKSGEGRPLDVHNVQPEALPAQCHVLFVASSQQRRSAAMIAAAPPGALTVGEAPDFIASGGMINLARRDRKIRLEINLEAAEAAGFKISSKLLGIADVVRGKPPH